MEEEINYIRLYSEGIETKAEIDVQSDQIKEGAQVGVFVYNTTSSEIVDKAENNCHTAVYTDGVYNLTTRDSTGM